ncbi:MAG TPA: type IV secretory system conjugative DNA transfer family protein, partial [Thermoanaerobaculia bacterium]|nr:type IV secretory system conjugative DNA transfer family protein [Thermoanaerobaculia bacterium]
PTETHRRLLTADEAMRLPADQSLIFAAGLPPIRGLKAPYFLDPVLSRRAAIPPPTLLARLASAP